MDLRGWDFKKDGPVQLNGIWEYYHYQRLVGDDLVDSAHKLKPEYFKVPSIVNRVMSDGTKIKKQDFGTFRLKILMDEPIEQPALFFKLLLGSYRVYVNGRELALHDASGKLNQNRPPNVGRWIADLEFTDMKDNMNAQNLEMCIIIHVNYASDLRPGLTMPISLGLESDLRPLSIRQSSGDIIIGAVLFVICIYCLAFYILLKKDMMPLYFALFCFSMGLRAIMSGNYVIYLLADFKLMVLERVLVCAIYCALPFLTMYIKSVFEEEFSIIAVRITQVTGIVCTVMLFVLPFQIAYKAIIPFEVIAISTLLYIFYVLFKALANKRDGSIILIFSFVIFLAAAVNDVLFERRILHTNYYLSYAMFVFVLAQAVLISKKYADAFIMIENQGEKLEAINIDLQHGIALRILAETSLKKSEEKYKSILESIREGYYEIDFTGRLADFNDSMVTILGYSRAELMAMNYQQLMTPQDLIEANKVFQKVAQTGRPAIEFEWGVIVKGGAKKWLEVSIGLKKDEFEQPDGFFGICRDITLRKEKEKAEREMEIEKEANQKIMSSIRYAKMIQTSILPDMNVMKQAIDDFFVIWKPRYVVSSELYFFEKLEHGFIIAVNDCTGRGVPGALMTMIADSSLKRIISFEEEADPGNILKRLNFIVKTSLGKMLKTNKNSSSAHAADDGLDAAIIQVDTIKKKLLFAGANRPIFILNQDGYTIINGDKQSIGFNNSNPDFEFTTQSLELALDASYYTFSDGFPNQPGGPEQRSFGNEKLAAVLEDIWQLPFDEQKNILESELQKHIKGNEIKDDITFVGFRVEA